MRFIPACLLGGGLFLADACKSPPLPPDAATSNALPRWEGLITTADGVQLFTRVVGSAPDTIIVLHGGPGFASDYIAADLEPLASRFTLIFYDQRGTGRSTLIRDSAGLDAQRFVDDLEAVRAHFGLAAPTLLGHSWGVGVAALYLQRHPTASGRLTLVDGVPLRRADLVAGFEAMSRARDSVELAEMDRLMARRRAHPEDVDACKAYYRLWFRPFFADSGALSRSRGDFCAGTAESRRNKMESVDRFTMASLGDWDWRAAMAGIHLRTLIIHGELDPIPLETAREWAGTVGNGRLLTLPEVGHFPYLEAPDAFFAAVDAFMAGSWPEGAQPGGDRP